MRVESLGLEIAVPKQKITPYLTINIVGDYNDADYIETHDKWELDKKDKEYIREVKESLDFLKENYETIFKPYFISEPNPEDADISEEFCERFDIPFCVDDCCHTIDEISITYTNEKGITYRVSINGEDPFVDDYEEDYDDCD